MVGVNDFVLEDEKVQIPILKIDPEVEKSRSEILRRFGKRGTMIR